MIKRICSLIFKARGWKFEGHLPPDLRSFIFLGAPHTSNYDFVPAMALSRFMKRNTKFVIKKEWLKFPFNLVLGPAGALGIDREKLKEGHGSTTDQMAKLFKEWPEIVLMIAPEGTRSPNPKWKTGFYYIAEKAGVPIVLGFADYRRKVAGIGPIIWPTNFEQDMAKIMEFYRHIQGDKPENFLLDERFNKREVS